MNSSGLAGTETDKLVAGPMFIVTSGLAVITVGTNALILVTFACQKRLWTYTNYYIINMTVADLLAGAVVMPIRSMTILYNGWPFGSVKGVIFLAVHNTCVGVSVLGVLVITIDRYIATLHPIQHYSGRTKRIAALVNTFTWIIPFVFWLFFNVVWYLLDPTGETIPNGLPRSNFTRTVALSLLTFCIRFALPFSLILILYIRVLVEINARVTKTHSNIAHKKDTFRKRAMEGDRVSEESKSSVRCISSDILTRKKEKSENNIRARSFGNQCSAASKHGNLRGGGRESMSTSDSSFGGKHDRVQGVVRGQSTAEGRKALKTLSFIILVFAITWLPIAFSVICYTMFPHVYKQMNDAFGFSDKARWISYTNSLFNPVAYTMAQPLIRQTIVNIFCLRVICRDVKKRNEGK
ncbi:alpha-1D adrenergic receptor-like [Diadema setosum]|uniref:alpha-1D adrenergic receptor-like n=1 Tax=Diadema setosum TaxID=31175 RepID=UPI003B3AB34C